MTDPLTPERLAEIRSLVDKAEDKWDVQDFVDLEDWRLVLSALDSREARIRELEGENERLRDLALSGASALARASYAYLTVQRGFERLQSEMDGVQGILVREGSNQQVGLQAP